MDALGLRQAVEAELEGNLLPFWRQRSPERSALVDPIDRGVDGFIGEMANDGTVRADAPRGLILNARLLWAFSSLFEARGDSRDLALARRAHEFLETRFRDHDSGGYLWRVDASGRPLDATKKIYGQAFAIYALSAYSTATRDASAHEAARKIFRLIEDHAHDDEWGGYIEARADDWSPARELRLSAKDMNAAKSMNTHLHVLEAYTGLLRSWPPSAPDAPDSERVSVASVGARLRELIELFGRHLLDRSSGHLHHFFDEDWTVLSDSYTYGHDIEAAWLLCEAAEVLGDASVTSEVEEWAALIAGAVADEAIDQDGGLAYEGRDGAVIDANREWWCQAEAVVGFWQVFGLTRDQWFADTAIRIWEFIERRVIDRTDGEWFWRIFPDGTPDPAEPKVSEWKGPYHNIRMCLETLRRIDGGRE